MNVGIVRSGAVESCGAYAMVLNGAASVPTCEISKP